MYDRRAVKRNLFGNCITHIYNFRTPVVICISFGILLATTAAFVEVMT